MKVIFHAKKFDCHGTDETCHVFLYRIREGFFHASKIEKT
jgi:hypothetical protein